jgi:hypothetical protein
MAAEICLSQLPQLLADPNAEFQVGLGLSLSQWLRLHMQLFESDCLEGDMRVKGLSITWSVYFTF